jgi:hypothetical protein
LEQELLQTRQNCATQAELIETYTEQNKQISMQLLEAQKRHEISVFARSDMQKEFDTAGAHLLRAQDQLIKKEKQRQALEEELLGAEAKTTAAEQAHSRMQHDLEAAAEESEKLLLTYLNINLDESK